jgi:subtilisin family serine protease
MAETPNVAMALPNYYHRLQKDMARARAAGGSVQYALPKLRVPDARALVSGRGVSVAVIDSGVDARHPALRDANLIMLDAVEGGDAEEVPDKHGTAIAGIIAARGGQVSGIAPEAEVFAVRAFAPERAGGPPLTTSIRVARAVDMALEQGARIFNLSFAGPRDPLLIAVIDAAYAHGAIFVAAAGNNGPKAPPAFPAAYDKVIAITATDERDRLYPHANRGDYVTAAAPGVDILVPVTGKGFDYLSGTSFAAAHISGIIALILERNPDMSADGVREVLTRGAQKLRTKHSGAGLADAYASLLLAKEK